MVTGFHLGAGTGLVQESQEVEIRNSPLLRRQGVCLVHKFPSPPPSASVEEEQVHQKERTGSPGGKQDAGTQRQKKDFPQLPPPERGAKQRAAQVKGGHPFKELK